MIGKHEWTGASPAFPTVNRYEIDTAIRGRHEVGQFPPELNLTNGRLDSHRETRRLSQRFHEVEQAVNVIEL